MRRRRHRSTSAGSCGDARVAAGLSQRAWHERPAMSHRRCRGSSEPSSADASVRTYAVLFAVLGSGSALGRIPDGDPIRDAGQVRLLSRFQALLPRGPASRPRSRCGIPGDLRAWDAELTLGDDVLRSRPRPLFATCRRLDRRIALKMADGGVVRSSSCSSPTPSPTAPSSGPIASCSEIGIRSTAEPSCGRSDSGDVPSAAGSWSSDWSVVISGHAERGTWRAGRAGAPCVDFAAHPGP